MPKSLKLVVAASVVSILLASSVYADDTKKAKEPTGQDVALNNKKGNCMACHLIPGDPKVVTSANIGPPLIAMKARFPDKKKLRDQIADATKVNPMSTMPPFGKNLILSDKEVDMVTDYIYGL